MPNDERAAMAAFAVDEYQRVVGGQAAQIGRTDQRGGIADGLGVDIEGRHNRSHQILQIGFALLDDLCAADHINGHGRFDDGTRFCPGTNDHQFFEDNHLVKDRCRICACGTRRFLRRGRSIRNEHGSHAEYERQKTRFVLHCNLL